MLNTYIALVGSKKAVHTWGGVKHDAVTSGRGSKEKVIRREEISLSAVEHLFW